MSSSTDHSSFLLDDDDDEGQRDDRNLPRDNRDPPIFGWGWYLGDGWRTRHTQSLLDAACSLMNCFLVLADRLHSTPPRRWPSEEKPRRDMEGCGPVIKQVGALRQIDIRLPPLLLSNDERLLMLLLLLDRGGMIILFVMVLGVRFGSGLVFYVGMWLIV
jgi:hypothetical protein